jgi:Trypsin-like peptidase domain/von Willebrand factor type A domain
VSHIVGTVQPAGPFTIGPDSGKMPNPANTWVQEFTATDPPIGKTKLVMLHFQNAILPASNRVEVDLGYDTDVFTAADGAEFWTRPVDVSKFPGGKVTIRYITSGAANGSVVFDKFGRGEQHGGKDDPSSIMNCDPFLVELDMNNYIEPNHYDPHWFCNDPPQWENLRCCLPAGDIRRVVAPSVGMIYHADGNFLGTCTVTLVGPDTVFTAGHCITTEEHAKSASVIFNYEVECGGAKPMGYAPRFHRVKKVLRQKFVGSVDYCLIQLVVPPGGLGIPEIVMRTDVPAVGEQIFCIHHPNGAVKKLSPVHPGFETINSVGADRISVDFDISGGSSGSGLFDTSGRILGVLAGSFPCDLGYYPTTAFLDELETPPGPAVARDVMIVFDRSGSMSMDAGTGQSKMEEARDAAALFVSLVRASGGNRLGLESFSTSASNPLDFAIATVNAANKTALIGPPIGPSKIGVLVASGNTTIGGGLKAAALAMTPAGVNPRAILLMTDGLQNTGPMIEAADVQGALAGIDVTAIGFGTEASLNGLLLTQLAEAHNGLYMRAGTGLDLKKFFGLAFGNMFEAGALMDPEFDLARDQRESKPIAFRVCGEETITIIIGWDNPDATLLAVVTTPGGVTVTGSSASVEQASGRTWTFLRIPLPHAGERDGTWKVTVMRPGSGSSEFPPPMPAAHGFVNVIANGGPQLRRWRDRPRYFTGDRINPIVALHYATGGAPENIKVTVTVKRPNASLGNILAQAKLKPAITLGGDTIPARQATLLGLENSTGRPVITYTETSFELISNPASTNGQFEPEGVFGNPRTDLLTVEGNYTFHVRATYGTGCVSTRELQWSVTVDPSIDPKHTTVTVSDGGRRPDGTRIGTATVTPRDPYGNLLGPGRGAELTMTGVAGTTVTEAVKDKLDGSYAVPIAWDPSTNPSVVIGQAGRPPVVVGPPLAKPKVPEPHDGKCKLCWALLVALILILLVLLLRSACGCFL